MSDLLLGCLATLAVGYLLVVPAVALALALRARRDAAELRSRLDQLVRERAPGVSSGGRVIPRERPTAREAASGPVTVRAGHPLPSSEGGAGPDLSVEGGPIWATRSFAADSGVLAGAEEAARPESLVPGTAMPRREPLPAKPGEGQESPSPSVVFSQPRYVSERIPAQPAASSAGRFGVEGPPIGGAGAGRTSPAPAHDTPGLEERLGARLPVWLGAIALALAGAFLVQYSVERGWLSPSVRVVLALLLGVGLLVGGEWVRMRSRSISEALSAAGIAVLYAALLAGVRLYELISPSVGFGLLSANTAVAVLLSVRRGPIPAVLGLVGGFLTPALVEVEGGGAAGLFGYLILLDVGLVAVSRRRYWPLLSLAALAASLLWVVRASSGQAPSTGPVLGLFVLLIALLFALRAGEALTLRAEGCKPLAEVHILALATPIACALALAVVVWRSEFGLIEWGFFGLLGAGCLALAALREEEHFWIAPVGAFATLGLLARWSSRLPEAERSALVLVTAGALALWSVAPYALLFRAKYAARWAALAGGSLALFPLAVALEVEGVDDLFWAVGFAALAAVAVLGVAPVAKRRGELSGGDGALGALAAAGALLASFAVAFALEREWLTVALALEVPALWAIAGRLELPILRRLGLLLAAIATIRLLLNPAILDYPIGPTPIWNLLLWGYGVPAVSLFAASRLALRQGWARSAIALEAGAAALAFAGVTLETVHALDPARLFHAFSTPGLFASSVLVAVWFLFGIGCFAAARRFVLPTLPMAGSIVVALASFFAVLWHFLIRNPTIMRFSVGESPVLNHLLLAYALPAALMLLAARGLPAAVDPRFANLLQAGALLFGFAWVTLEVRHLFRGGDLATGGASPAERFAYSAAWAVLATLLLVLGVARRLRGLRLAALSVMLLVVLKVFLVDASGLTGLYRVASFLGLGACLLLLAWLYQRYVFRREEER